MVVTRFLCTRAPTLFKHVATISTCSSASKPLLKSLASVSPTPVSYQAMKRHALFLTFQGDICQDPSWADDKCGVAVDMQTKYLWYEGSTDPSDFISMEESERLYGEGCSTTSTCGIRALSMRPPMNDTSMRALNRLIEVRGALQVSLGFLLVTSAFWHARPNYPSHHNNQPETSFSAGRSRSTSTSWVRPRATTRLACW